MNNFEFQNPTKLIFGKGTISRLSKEIPQDKVIMIVFGGGSVRENGVYAQVAEAMKNHQCVEFWGVTPNPTVETVRKAVQKGKQENVNYILSVGGGSVLDATKLIAAAIPYDGDAWDLVLDDDKIGATLPFSSVMTLPATGSEMNNGAVISNAATQEKLAFNNTFPQFSILDPEVTYTLPPYQIACGLADTFVHVIEQYLTTTDQSILMDHWAEGVMQTIVEITPHVLQDKTNYDYMCQFMLSATMALNGFISMGITQDWATHMIGHELTALKGLTHGQSLAIVLPAAMTVLQAQKHDKILQYGERVWRIDVTQGKSSVRLIRAIQKTEDYFRSLGLATRLSEVNIGMDTIEDIERRFNEREVKYGEAQNVNGSVARAILEEAL